MQSPLPTLIFAGPSLTPQSKQLIENTPQATLCPPIQRGDLPDWLEQGFQGHIIIADGLFGQTLAIGHAEIREALQQGCKIYGVSSMGAIRAYEMHHMGVIGIGQVYERFARSEEEDFQDDEVTLLHTPAPECRALSEPLIHLRVCVEDLIQQQVLSKIGGQEIIAQLKQMYFGDRTLYLFQQLVAKHTTENISTYIDKFENYRIKNSDLTHFLKRIFLKSDFTLSN
ncbi:hypothetical protein BKI52_29905 [marine bacterium AO1-C]|nr:hypothetical protein BKI52_29905 [marine bacterium AO1-C]